MAVLRSVALHEQLSIIMGALTTAAVAEICELVDEGYRVLQREISRSHKENEDLKKKLHLIESIVVRGGSAGFAPVTEGDPRFELAAEGAQQPETTQLQPDSDRGDTVAAPGGEVVVVREELPDVVLIKDEDSDSNHSFAEGDKTPADGGTAAVTPVRRSVKRHWPGGEDADRKSSSEPLALKPTKKSVTVYSLDSPRSEPGCSSSLEAGESICSFSSQMDPECSVIPSNSNRQTYTESPTNRELDLSPKTHLSFPQFQHNGNLDSDAFGLKMVSVTGSFPADGQLSESSSNSAFEYDDAMNFAHFRDQSSGHAQQHGARERRFVCSMCSKTYATSQNLEVHMRIHTGERPFSCSQCGKKFTQSAHLKSHMSVHTGERPYVCTLCQRSFIVKYSLKLHMDRCHV